MVIENVLLAEEAGLGNGETPIFPIHIFKVKEGVNYNSEKQENGVETQTVYKVKEGKYLERHLQYNYTHDEKGRVSTKEILKWNQDNSRFEKLYCLNFSYTDNEVNVEYVAWNNKIGDYTDVKAKAVYQMNEQGINYTAYNWDKKENAWNLTVGQDNRFTL